MILEQRHQAAHAVLIRAQLIWTAHFDLFAQHVRFEKGHQVLCKAAIANFQFTPCALVDAGLYYLLIANATFS